MAKKKIEVINDLLGYEGLKIIQRPDIFNFSLDSTILADFVTINKSDKTIIDMGCGNGYIPIFLTLRTNAMITGIEIQEEIYDLAIRSVELNNLQDRINIYNLDLKEAHKILGTSIANVVTCNPPYFKYQDDSLVNTNDIKTIARHEVKLNLEDVVIASKYILKNGGTFAMVHRPDRMIEIINLMQKYGIEPKRMRLVYPKMRKESNILLIEGIKNGKIGLKVLSPLYIHNEDGSYVDEIKEMFGGNEDVAE